MPSRLIRLPLRALPFAGPLRRNQVVRRATSVNIETFTFLPLNGLESLHASLKNPPFILLRI